MYQLVFQGECAPGVDEETARANAKGLFKASDAQILKMFAGGRVVIRNQLDQPTAEKYQAVLKKNGIISHIEPMPGTQEPATEPKATEAPPAPTPKSAPADAETATPAAGGDLPLAGERVDDILSRSDLSLGAPGETLGSPREAEPPVFDHLDDWTLAEPGADLADKRETPPPPAPDTSHLTLADDKKQDSD